MRPSGTIGQSKALGGHPPGALSHVSPHRLPIGVESDQVCSRRRGGAKLDGFATTQRFVRRMAPAAPLSAIDTDATARSARGEGIGMAIDKVRSFLRERGMEDRVMEFDTSSATVELAAQAVGVEPARIAKTLSFYVGDRVALIVAAGDARIDNPKYKAQFHTKAKMLSAADAEERIGHAVGGVCPFAVNDGCDIYLDASLRRFEEIYPAAGSSSSAVRLTCDELEQLCAPCTWIDVCKLPS